MFALSVVLMLLLLVWEIGLLVAFWQSLVRWFKYFSVVRIFESNESSFISVLIKEFYVQSFIIRFTIFSQPIVFGKHLSNPSSLLIVCVFCRKNKQISKYSNRLFPTQSISQCHNALLLVIASHTSKHFSQSIIFAVISTTIDRWL